MSKTYHLKDDYDDVVVKDDDETSREPTWRVISWLEGFYHAPATTVMRLYNEGKYATALELYDRSQF